MAGKPQTAMKPLLIFALTFANALAADHPDPALAGMDAATLARIPARMKAFVADGTAAGFVTLIARHGQVVSLEAVGYQNREAKTPMRTDSLFQIQSMTKPVTCAAFMILMEGGRLSLIDPVEKYLPEFKGKKAAIRDLMTHTSGIAGTLPKGFEKSAHTLAEVVSAGAAQPAEFEPGAKWSYNNTGIATLGRIVEVLSGQTYEGFMQIEILNRLGMKDTHFFLPDAKRNRLATVYTDDHGVLKRSDLDPFREGNRYPGPEGGLYSTAQDMARFYQMMLNQGTFNGQRILSPASVQLMTTVQTGDLKAGFAPGMGYGLGWAVVREPAGMFRLNSLGTYGHGGAYRTYGWVDPAKDLVGVLMFQRTNGGGDVADEINAFVAMANAAVLR